MILTNRSTVDRGEGLPWSTLAYCSVGEEATGYPLLLELEGAPSYRVMSLSICSKGRSILLLFMIVVAVLGTAELRGGRSLVRCGYGSVS